MRPMCCGTLYLMNLGWRLILTGLTFLSPIGMAKIANVQPARQYLKLLSHSLGKSHRKVFFELFISIFAFYLLLFIIVLYYLVFYVYHFVFLFFIIMYVLLDIKLKVVCTAGRVSSPSSAYFSQPGWLPGFHVSTKTPVLMPVGQQQFLVSLSHWPHPLSTFGLLPQVDGNVRLT